MPYASGALIGLKNADDWYTPHAVADAVFHLAGNQPRISCTVIPTSSGKKSRLQTSLFRSDHHRIGHDGGVDHRTVFATQEVYRQFTYDLRYRICADYDWYLNLLEAGKRFAHTGTVISYKRPGGASGGDQTLRDAFAINQKHFGRMHAVKVRIRQLGIKYGLGAANILLRAFLGAEGFAKFKARKK